MAEEPKVVTRTGRKVNYLNNRDILKEIHKSKATYCKFLDKDTQHQQDAIVYDLVKINKARIKEAKADRIDRHKRATGEILKPSEIADVSVMLTASCFRTEFRKQIHFNSKSATFLNF